MRPWFTLTIIAIIAGCLLSFWLVVDFVLLNRVMFETPFNIALRLPFPPWLHRWTEVQFMYILTISVLLGAGIVACTTLIFDTKRALKVRRMRKELARLQEALEEAQAKLPSPPVSENAEKKDSSNEDAEEHETLSSETTLPDDEASVTPEEIAHSFEDVVEQGDFLKVAQKRVEDELERHGGRRPEGDIRAIVTGSTEELSAISGQEEDVVTSEKNAENREDESDTLLQQEPTAEDAGTDTETPPESSQVNSAQECVDTEEAQVPDNANNQNTEQEFSEAEQESKSDVLDSNEHVEARNVDEEKDVSATEADVVDDGVLSDEENAQSDDAVPMKKPPSD